MAALGEGSDELGKEGGGSRGGGGGGGGGGGDRSAGKSNLQSVGVRSGGTDLGKDERAGGLGARGMLSASLGKPRAEGGVFNPMLLGEGQSAEAAPVEGFKDSCLEAGAVAGATDSVVFDDCGSRCVIHRCHRSEVYGTYECSG
jgi:hypothetical protein